MDYNYILSICIASYNRGEELSKKIEKLLSIKEDRLQIVVSDNASTDQTISLLEKIDDHRLKIIINTNNQGPTANYVRALKEGDGKYVMFMTDKDYLCLDELPTYLSFLETYNFGTGYCHLNYNGSIKIEKYHAGYQALSEIAYLAKHPTGYIYSRECLHSIDDLDWYSDKDNVDAFPFEFLCAKIACNKSVAIISLPLLCTKKLEEKKEKSLTYSSENDNIFFAPNKRYLFMLKCIEHLQTLNLNQNDKTLLMRRIYIRFWRLSVIIYPDFLTNKDLCDHYGIECKKIDLREVLSISKDFLKKYEQFTSADNNSTLWYKRWTTRQNMKIIIKMKAKLLLKKD